MTKNARKIKAAVLMAGLVVAGALLGASIVYMLFCKSVERADCPDAIEVTVAESRRFRRNWYSKERLERRMERFRKQLDLTEEQEAAVREIMVESWKTLREIRKQIRPDMRKERENAREKIRAVLTQEQKAEYEKMIERHRKRRAERRKGEKG